MKKLYILILLVWHVTGWSQDTTGYDLLAHYPFLSDAADATGNNPDAVVQNASFTNGGIYSNGVYYGGGGQNGCLIAMDGINGFNADDFIITFEAQLSSNTANFVFVCGAAYRWLSLEANDYQLLEITYLSGPNFDFGSYTTNTTLNTGQWYQFGLKYSSSDHNLMIYVDNNLAGTVNIPDGFATDNEMYFSNTHGGYGMAFHGYWRHVKYYIPHSINTVDDLTDDYVTIYQHPDSGIFIINLLKQTGGKLTLIDITGQQVWSRQLTKGLNKVDISGFNKGIYILKFDINNLKFTRKIIKR